MLKEVRIIKQVAVRLSDEDRQLLKVKVIQNNTSVQAILEDFIKAYISDDKKDEQQ